MKEIIKDTSNHDQRFDRFLRKYYKTQTNLPWAINISDKFSYLYEKEAINTGYLKFNAWAESGGALYPDWYVNTAVGYRNSSKIYNH